MLASFCLLDESLSLLNHPNRIRIPSTLRDDDLAALKVHEYQDVQVDDAPSRHGAFGKEVASPKGLGMGFEIIVPGTAASFGAWLDVFLFQDVLDRLATDSRDAEAAEFSEDLGIAEPGLPSDLEHEVTKDLAFASRLAYGGLAAFRLPSPAVESAWSHDRDQFFDSWAKRQTEFEEPITFFTASVNLLRDSRTKDQVLFLEVADLATQMTVGSTSDERQQRVKQLGHGSSLV